MSQVKKTSSTNFIRYISNEMIPLFLICINIRNMFINSYFALVMVIK